MGSVFGGATQTPTRANESSADCKQQTLGLLNLKAMTDPTALAGTKGTEASLIHGETWNQMEVNQTENILGWQKFTVTGVETHKALSNLVHRVDGSTNDTRVGVHNQTNIAPRNDEFMHTRTETHHRPEQIHQPTQLMNIQKDVTEYLDKHTKFSSWYFSMVAIKMDVTPVVSLGFATLEGKLGVIATKALVMEKKSKALDAKYQAAVTHFTLTAVLASVLWAKVITFDGNAGIAANADSPFA